MLCVIQLREAGKKHALLGNKAVGGFGEPRKTGNVLVGPDQPAIGSVARKGFKYSARAASNRAILANQVNRGLELIDGQRRISRTYLLIRSVVDLSAGELAPAFDPTLTKAAIAVEYE